MISSAVDFAAEEIEVERRASREGRDVDKGRRASSPVCGRVAGEEEEAEPLRLWEGPEGAEREGARARERPRERGGTEMSEPCEWARR